VISEVEFSLYNESEELSGVGTIKWIWLLKLDLVQRVGLDYGVNSFIVHRLNVC